MNITGVEIKRINPKYLLILGFGLFACSFIGLTSKVSAAAPDTFIITKPDAISELVTPEFVFEANESSTFECRIDLGEYSACVSPFTTASLANGPHTFDVKATNEALETDVTPATYNWTVSAIDGIYINDCEELQLIGSDGYYTTSQNYVLANDIDCSDTANWNEGTGWVPLASFADKFSGTLDGDGHTINDLYLNRVPGGALGLFKYSSNATFRDFTINGSIGNPSSEVGTCIGGVVAYAVGYVHISGVTVNVDLSGEQDTGGGFVGCMTTTSGDSYFHDSTYDGTISTGAGAGLIGEAHLYDTATMDVDSVTTAGTIEATSQTGGLFGIYSYLWDDTSSGDQLTIAHADSGIDVTGANYVGGMVGTLAMQHLGFRISDSSFTGIINSTTGETGGLIGMLLATNSEPSQSTIIRSFVSTGIVADGNNVGGFVGSTNADQILTIEQSYAAGVIDGQDADYIGGFVGNALGSTNVADSYTDVTLYGDNYVGGLFGNADAAIVDRSFSLTEIHSTSSVLGGLAGSYNNGEINDSFAAATIDSTWPTTVGGLAGTMGNSVVTNSFTDTNIGNKGCAFTSGAETPNTIECTAIDEANYFFNNVGDEPMVGWDFADVWRANSSFYPCLQWQEYCQTFEPQVQCDMPEASDESIWGHCQLLVRAGYDYGTTTWEARWKLASDTDYTPITLEDELEAIATVNGLQPYTDYYMEFRFTNNWGTGDWERLEFRTIPSADDDGIPNAVEDAAPNGGDANSDGTTDVNQSNVGSYLNEATDTYVVVEVGAGCVLSDIHTLAEATNSTQDSAFNYAAGLVGFSADCGSNGAQTTAKVYFYGQTKDNITVRKYNPATNSYFSVTSANNVQLQQATIGGQTVTIASYTIKDGGNLDIDGLENGVIVDPVGLGVSTVASPNTGLRRR